MTNVLRYTPEHTNIEIAVGTETSTPDGASGPNAPSTQSVIKIRDHGPGISEEDAEKIFQRFYRADTSRHRDTGGSGLGLAIVAGIVSQHKGSVRHEDTPGGGATMIVRLPYHPLEPESFDEDEGEDDFSTENFDEQ